MKPWQEDGLVGFVVAAIIAVVLVGASCLRPKPSPATPTAIATVLSKPTPIIPPVFISPSPVGPPFSPPVTPTRPTPAPAVSSPPPDVLPVAGSGGLLGGRP